jgi:hypothetical protein
VTKEYNVLALLKGKEKYVFVYDDTSRIRLLDILRDHAADPALSFSWFDAAVLSDKARQQEAAATELEQEEAPKSRI